MKLKICSERGPQTVSGRHRRRGRHGPGRRGRRTPSSQRRGLRVPHRTRAEGCAHTRGRGPPGSLGAAGWRGRETRLDKKITQLRSRVASWIFLTGFVSLCKMIGIQAQIWRCSSFLGICGEKNMKCHENARCIFEPANHGFKRPTSKPLHKADDGANSPEPKFEHKSILGLTWTWRMECFGTGLFFMELRFIHGISYLGLITVVCGPFVRANGENDEYPPGCLPKKHGIGASGPTERFPEGKTVIITV